MSEPTKQDAERARAAWLVAEFAAVREEGRREERERWERIVGEYSNVYGPMSEEWTAEILRRIRKGGA